MIERPILMSGSMARATLRDIEPKTQTRRVVKPQPWPSARSGHYGRAVPSGSGGMHPASAIFSETLDRRPPWAASQPIKCPFGEPGDRLWVREALGFDHANGAVTYAADGTVAKAIDPTYEPRRARPSIHMPRWASRITLEITDIRVERVRDICWLDAIAEGVERFVTDDPELQGMWRDYSEPGMASGNPIGSFMTLWNSLNAERGHGWRTNPWVWVIQFKRIAP